VTQREIMKLGIVIPAFEEEESIGDVVERCLTCAQKVGNTRVVVCDNMSRDETGIEGRRAGAEVVTVEERGYGAACWGGIQHLGKWPDLLVFIDADASSRPEEIPCLVRPIEAEGADLVIGRRPKSAPMTFPQRWGTWIAVRALNLRWRSQYQDMGPFRCITRQAFECLGMQDRRFGWTIEMQILAEIKGLKVVEVPVSWEERSAGVSKISGTVAGVTRAAMGIFWTLSRYVLRRRERGSGLLPGGCE
jgi:glycosyltransferase involved in cell wall biosynthesis